MYTDILGAERASPHPSSASRLLASSAWASASARCGGLSEGLPFSPRQQVWSSLARPVLWTMPAVPSTPAPDPSVRTVNMLEAKTHLSRLVEAIETGAAREVVIARNGRPVARLTGLQAAQPPRRLGVARGQFRAPESIDGINAEIAALFEQD